MEKFSVYMWQMIRLPPATICSTEVARTMWATLQQYMTIHKRLSYLCDNQIPPGEICPRKAKLQIESALESLCERKGSAVTGECVLLDNPFRGAIFHAGNVGNCKEELPEKKILNWVDTDVKASWGVSSRGRHKKHETDHVPVERWAEK